MLWHTWLHERKKIHLKSIFSEAENIHLMQNTHKFVKENNIWSMFGGTRFRITHHLKMLSIKEDSSVALCFTGNILWLPINVMSGGNKDGKYDREEKLCVLIDMLVNLPQFMGLMGSFPTFHCVFARLPMNNESLMVRYNLLILV